MLIQSPHLEVLSKLCRLKQLDLSHTAIEGNTLQVVSPALQGLQRLDVSYTPMVSRAIMCVYGSFQGNTNTLHKSALGSPTQGLHWLGISPMVCHRVQRAC